MNKELIIELESIYKIADKKKRNEMLSEFSDRNNLVVKPAIIETTLLNGEKNTLTLNFYKYEFRGVDDPIYRIIDDYFTELNPNFDKGYYDHVNSLFNKNKKICLNDDDNIFFYSPELYYLLTNRQPILANKFNFIATTQSTQHKINTLNWETEYTTLDTNVYLETYINAFADGKSDFDNSYSNTLNNLYQLTDKQVLDFVDTLKKKYYPSCSTENELGKCWKFVENNYSNIIRHKVIYNFGYNSGKIAQLENAIKNHPKKFKNFYTPFYYSDDIINENVFWRILNEIFLQNLDINLGKNILFKEFEKLVIDSEIGIFRMNYFFMELNNFLNKETSIFQGEIVSTNDVKIYISNNYSYQIELTDEDIKYIQNLFDNFSNTQQKDTQLLKDKSSNNQTDFKTIQDIFVDSDNWEQYFKCFSTSDTKLLKIENNKYYFIGNKKTQSGCIITYMKKLKDRGIVKPNASNKIIAMLLNRYILNYQIDASSFYNESEKYKDFEKFLL